MPKPTILIVDDELFFRRLFSEILAEGDLYDIHAVNSGRAALDFLEKTGADIILADMVMPEVCGLELVRRTRSLDPAPDIILVTGNASVESAIQALKGGARDYLLKPCNPEQLRHTVRACLEQRRLIAENSLLQSQVRLYRKGQHLSGLLDIDTLFHEALKALMSEIGDGRGLAFHANQGGISHVFAQGFEDIPARQLAELLEDRAAAVRPADIMSAVDCPGCAALDEDLRELWFFPLESGSDTRGALVICNPRDAQLSIAEHRESLMFLAEQIAFGYRNACQYQGARELIYTDDLTGLYNHRYLHIALDQEIRRAERYGLEFSLAFIDLDLFKNINDVHGHLIGSGVLRQVGDLLRECVRDADMLFRYGGDEFTALLVETDSRGAKIVAERIRSAIEGFAFTTGKGRTDRLTATVGHATYPIHATNREGMIELADKAMYEGKNERNTARSASDLSKR